MHVFLNILFLAESVKHLMFSSSMMLDGLGTYILASFGSFTEKNLPYKSYYPLKHLAGVLHVQFCIQSEGFKTLTTKRQVLMQEQRKTFFSF